MVTLTSILMSTRTVPQIFCEDVGLNKLFQKKLAADDSFEMVTLTLDGKTITERVDQFVGQEGQELERLNPHVSLVEIKTPSFLESLISGISSLLKTILQEFKQNVQSTMSKIKSFAERIFSTPEIVLQKRNSEVTNLDLEFTEIKL